jgi:plasmid stabilization system protein ParE
MPPQVILLACSEETKQHFYAILHQYHHTTRPEPTIARKRRLRGTYKAPHHQEAGTSFGEREPYQVAKIIRAGRKNDGYIPSFFRRLTFSPLKAQIRKTQNQRRDIAHS